MFQFIFSKLNDLKIFPYYIVTPCIYAIGTASEAILDAYQKSSKKILIIKLSFFSKNLNYNVCNHALFDKIYKNNSQLNYIDKFIKILIRIFIEIEFIFLRFFLLKVKKIFGYKLLEEMGFPKVGISTLYSDKKIKFNNFHNKNYYSIKKLNKKKIDFEIDINKKELDFLKIHFLNKIYKNKKNKYICLHVRDSDYRKDFKRRSFRNSSINNYIPTIKFLISKGFTVIRLGNYGAKKINFKHKFFFDYSKSKIRNDIIDLYLIKNCFFFISTQSGIYDTARLFNKPILITNMVNLFSSYCQGIKTRGIFKEIIYKGKKINIKEYANLPFYEFLSESPYGKNLKYIENNSIEIKNATKEFLSLMISGNFKLSKKQKKINSFFKNKLKNIFYNEIKKQNKQKTSLSQKQNLRMIKYFKSCEGSLINSSLGNL